MHKSNSTQIGLSSSHLGLSRRARFIKQVREHWLLLVMFIPVLAYYLFFMYAPMFNHITGGIFMPFRKFTYNKTFFDWKPMGLYYFHKMWNKPDFWQSFFTTLKLSILKLIFGFPMPIILALLLNEVQRHRAKRFFQTVYTFPHFLSWVIVAGIMRDLLTSNGLVNGVITAMGGHAFPFLASQDLLPNYIMLIASDILKGIGWGSIIYLAAIAGIDSSLYEAAIVDGANRWHCVRFITWPSIKATAVILLILQVGAILNGSFDQIINLVNGVNRNAIETLDVFIYRYAFGSGINQSFTAAAGLFKSVINFVMLVIANVLAKRLGNGGLI